MAKIFNFSSNKARFNILVNGHDEYIVSPSEDAINTKFSIDQRYFAYMKYPNEQNAKHAIDEYLMLEQKAATRIVCQYP